MGYEINKDTSAISFLGEDGDRIKFSLHSNLEVGELDIVLYDSNDNKVYELDRAETLETYFNLEKSDTYMLQAECSDFVGNYSVTFYKSN